MTDGQAVEAELVDDKPVEAEEPELPFSDTPPKAARVWKPISYSFVKDMNFVPEGKQTLRAFFAEKAPKSVQEQVTVVLYYILKVMGKTGVGTNHIYTRY